MWNSCNVIHGIDIFLVVLKEGISDERVLSSFLYELFITKQMWRINIQNFIKSLKPGACMQYSGPIYTGIL